MTIRTPAAKRFVKRVARRLFVTGSGAIGVGKQGVTSSLRILTYHRVTADAEDPFSVAPDEFTRQIRILSTIGLVVSLEEALGKLATGQGDTPLIALTFDDGTEDFISGVLPILTQLRLPATLYVSPERVGNRGFLEWSDLAEVGKSGIRIGSHGMDHQSLTRLRSEDVWRQVSESRRILEDRFGHEVTSMAYPFGTVRDFSQPVKDMVRKAGYHSACTSVNGVNQPGVDLFELRRTKIEQGDGIIFEAILAGRLDAWAFFDRHLHILQNRYA